MSQDNNVAVKFAINKYNRTQSVLVRHLMAEWHNGYARTNSETKTLRVLFSIRNMSPVGAGKVNMYLHIPFKRYVVPDITIANSSKGTAASDFIAICGKQKNSCRQCIDIPNRIQKHKSCFGMFMSPVRSDSFQ